MRSLKLEVTENNTSPSQSKNKETLRNLSMVLRQIGESMFVSVGRCDWAAMVTVVFRPCGEGGAGEGEPGESKGGCSPGCEGWNFME